MAVEAVTRATKLTNEVANLLLAIKSFADTVVTLVENASAELDSLKRSEIKYNAKIKFAHQDLVKAAERAITYINRVEDLFHYGHKGIGEVIASLKIEKRQRYRKRVFLFFWRSYFRSVPAPEYGPLRDFLDQLKRFLVQTEELYQEFKDAIETANTSSIQAAEDCDYKAREAQKNQTNAVVKGSLMGAGAATALTVLTGGLGSLFGLSGGAAMAGGCALGVAAGAGAAKITYDIVRDLQNSEKAFKKLSANLDCLAQHASDISTSTLQVQGTLEVLAMSVDDVEHSQRKHETPESLCCSLDRLCEKFGESFEVVSKCRATVEAKTTELGLYIN